ncbi:MAG TPA: hypothetical protein VG488_11850 [Candidatus Angelobacter sp.]|jgi:hypothetical protein|nr:hypothetical protein [Candidatus Angelobacter sp.]
MDAIRKNQLAVQIVAIMKADFNRPSDEEMESILDIAKEQIRDITQIAGLTMLQSQASCPRP